MIRHAQGRRAEAEPLYRRALSLAPAHERLDTLAGLGALLHQNKRPDEAEAYFRQLLALIPTAVPADEARLGQALEYDEQLLRQRRELVDAERVALLAMRFRVRHALRHQ